MICRTRYTSVLFVAACGRVNFALETDATSASGSTVERAITIVAQPTDMADAVVGLAVDDLDPSRTARDDGADIHFVDTGGALLDYEVELWSPTTRRLLAWVKVPLLAATQATTIYVRYGGNLITHDATRVWTGHANHVWHLGEQQPPFGDSAAAAIDGVPPAAMATPVTAPGIWGNALAFDGVDDTLPIGDPADGSLDFGTGSFAISVWVHVTSSAGTFDQPWWKGGSSAGQVGYDLELGTADWSFDVVDGTNLVQADFGAELALLGSWHYLVGVIDRQAGVSRAYLDGQLTQEQPLGALGSLSSATNAQLSRAVAVFKGVLDEVRVHPRALTAAEIALTYQIATAPSAVLTIGSEQPTP